jgi:hypothetical protein
MSDIELTGLRADLPIGAMAALGVLRICQRAEPFRGSKLSWRRGGGSFHAVLHTRSESGPDELLEAIAADVKRAAERLELTWRGKLKGLMPDEFRVAAGSVVEASSREERETADWFAAFGSDSAVDREGRVDATPLDMTGGPQEFLAGARELAVRMSIVPAGNRKVKTPVESFREALFGPWRYEDDQHSLGWDPTAIKLGAFTYKAPTKMANSGVQAAVWLAFESLPLFPCFTVRGLVQARAFQRTRRQFVFSWPVWTEPIGLETTGYLLALQSDERLLCRGVAAVYQSERFNLNKYYAAFRAPQLALGGSAAAAV